jgi:hypothetical protein
MAAATSWRIYLSQSALQMRMRIYRFLSCMTQVMHLDQLNPRQEKALLRMFEEGPDGFKGGMSAAKYIRPIAWSTATITQKTRADKPISRDELHAQLFN